MQRSRLLDGEFAPAGNTEELATAIEEEIQAMVAEAAQYAADSPYPDGNTAVDFVYARA